MSYEESEKDEVKNIKKQKGKKESRNNRLLSFALINQFEMFISIIRNIASLGLWRSTFIIKMKIKETCQILLNQLWRR